MMVPHRVDGRRRSAAFDRVGLTLVCALATMPLHGAAPADPQSPHHAHPPVEAAAPRAEARPMAAQPRIDAVPLIDQDGRPVTLHEAVTADGPVLLNFIFTSCTTICPVMTAGFAQLDSRLHSDHQTVRLVSISIDPEFDTAARLRAYAARAGASKHWRFLTGSPAAIEAAQRAFGAYRGSKDNHAPATYVRRAADLPWEQRNGLASADALERMLQGGGLSNGPR